MRRFTLTVGIALAALLSIAAPPAQVQAQTDVTYSLHQLNHFGDGVMREQHSVSANNGPTGDCIRDLQHEVDWFGWHYNSDQDEGVYLEVDWLFTANCSPWEAEIGRFFSETQGTSETYLNWEYKECSDDDEEPSN